MGTGTTIYRSRIQMPYDQLVRALVEHHVLHDPDKNIGMAIWRNPADDPWDKGVDLVEICGIGLIDQEPDFKPVQLGAMGGWPKVRLVLTNVGELNLEDETCKASGARSFLRSLDEELRGGAAKEVYPVLHGDGNKTLDSLVGTV